MITDAPAVRGLASGTTEINKCQRCQIILARIGLFVVFLSVYTGIMYCYYNRENPEISIVMDYGIFIYSKLFDFWGQYLLRFDGNQLSKRSEKLPRAIRWNGPYCYYP